MVSYTHTYPNNENVCRRGECAEINTNQNTATIIISDDNKLKGQNSKD